MEERSDKENIERDGSEKRAGDERRQDSDRRAASQSQILSIVYPEKADLLHRMLARVVDLLIFGFLCMSFYPIGVLAGLFYLLIADGFFEGRSVGKRLIGLRVVMEGGGQAVGFRESIIRNMPIALIALFSVIPIIGWILLFTIGLLLVSVELYLAFSDERGQRAGDILARTVVIANTDTTLTQSKVSAEDAEANGEVEEDPFNEEDKE